MGSRFARIFEPDAAGRPQGLGVDLLRRTLGENLHMELLPYQRAQYEVEIGEADVLIGPYRTPEREARFLFSQRAFYEDAMLLYARRGEASLWNGQFAALASLSIGAVKGWAYGAGFESMRPHLQRLTLVNDVATGLKMLQLGRLDLFASNERNTQPELEALQLEGLLIPQAPPLDLLRGHFAFTRSAAGETLRRRHDTQFEALLRQGEFARLAQRWGVRMPQ
ncbi:polar amino acid transport system substrate-binding protein [Inhella inkyongensis]|uniref:Polar amino acid transport system substrate-binding protein n=1 Tax=Inhella inkyongensis TaxID=392593 RepID=A0A840S3H4_9BURK|nr:transporter substrate-binding domain-containing protein [Inhella inkyongensis]MBB5205787.1 polar amino acid transport system substrate-binding protein [Inhella inkyongensis]